MEQLQLKDQSSHLAVEESTPTTSAEEEQPQSLLIPAGSLVEQCQGCSQELQRLAEQAFDYAEISVFAKTILFPIASQLKDIRLRLDIWMADIDIEKGTLNESDSFRQSRLFGVITTALQRMNSNLGAVGKDLTIINNETELIARTEHVTLRYYPGSLLTGIKQAEARISDALSTITAVLRNLADLASSIQMFRAMQAKEGPYADLTAQISSIKAQPKDGIGQIPAAVSTSLEEGDVDQCPACRRWFEPNELVAHVADCPKPDMVSSVQSQPPQASTTFDKPVNTDVRPSSPRSPFPPPPPPPRQPYTSRISEGQDLPSGERKGGSSGFSRSDSQATFVNLHNEEDCARMYEQVKRPETYNFVLCLQRPNPSIAVDVNYREEAWNNILVNKVHVDAPRWINIWQLNAQRNAVRALAKFYSFSPLLMENLLATESRPSPRYKPPKTNKAAFGKSPLLRSSKLAHDKEDIELGKYSELTDIAFRDSYLQFRGRGSFPETGADSLHYTWMTVDQRYICIAYNRSYSDVARPRNLGDSSGCLKKGEDLDRVRSWLILCDDGTIISIHERLLSSDPNLYGSEQKTLRYLKLHTLTVLDRLLTSQGSKEKGSFRVSESIPRAWQDASMLLYLLYDDSNFFSDFTPDINQYGWVLESCREDIRSSPSPNRVLDLVSELGDLRPRLSGLKRFFRSSVKLIDYILDPPPEYREVDEDPFAGDVTPLAVRNLLSHATRMLFLRLRRRIDVHCIMEVESLIEKEEVVDRMLSQLSAINQSKTLPAPKARQAIFSMIIIVLLSLILMSTYFSTTISDLQGVYTATTYWATFTVIVVINLLFFIGFDFVRREAKVGGRLWKVKEFLDTYMPFSLKSRG